VSESLHWDVWLDGDWVHAKVEGGKVTLEGTVGSEFAKLCADHDAFVFGVTAVNDDALKVVPNSLDRMRREARYIFTADDDLRRNIEASLHRDPRVSAFAPAVQVKAGIATLTGAVGTPDASAAAAADAEQTLGVLSVKNQLKITGRA